VRALGGLPAAVLPAAVLPAAVLLAAVLAGCAAPVPAATPAPAGPRTLVDLIAAAPESPPLTLDETTRVQGTGFSTVVASYPSEGLTITGLLYVPDGDGPFPGVVVVHGSVDPDTFTTGSDLVREQEALAGTGHVVFAPDLRGYGRSDPDPSDGTDAGVGATLDIVNAGRALGRSGIPGLDGTRIGLFGHSLGGGESLAAMVVAPEVFDAVVAMSPVSSRPWWVIDHYDARDSAAFAAIVAVHGTYEDDPGHWDDLASSTFASRATAPLLIAYGTADDPVYATWQEHTVADWQAAGAPVELLTVAGGDHRLDPGWESAWTRISAFLDENLGA
jgi:dipeptidyl aminopeptidase/acylaminoacyl peptidase